MNEQRVARGRVKTSDAPFIRGRMSKFFLPAGRLFYAGTSGIGLVFSTQATQNLAAVGEYIYQIGFASAFATVAGLGLDRVMARRMAAFEMPVGIPTKILLFRAGLCGVILAVSAALGLMFEPALLYSGLFVISRVLYADLEAIWIGAKLGDAFLFVALVVNGLVTGGGLILGSQIGSAAMMAFSSLGNVLAVLVLILAMRVKLVQDSPPGLINEAHGISWSLILAVVYARADLVVMAALGVPLEAVAFYGIVTRVFDALALLRGARAQHEAREVAPLRPGSRARRLLALSARTQFVLGPIAILGTALLWVVKAAGIGLLDSVDPSSVGYALAALPLFFSHLPTTAMIYSDRRTHRLLIGSLITCAGSIALKWALIKTAGVHGAILAIGLVEVVSCLTFYLLYWDSARTWRSSQIVWLPLSAGIGATLMTYILL